MQPYSPTRARSASVWSLPIIQLGAIVKRLGPRWFVVRSAKSDQPSLLNPRWAMSYLRGPMTQSEIRRAMRRGG